jgi:hypothetical protein
LDDIADQLASAGYATSPNIEDAFLSLLNQLVEALQVSVTALQDFFLNALREAGDLVVGRDCLVTRKGRSKPGQGADARRPLGCAYPILEDRRELQELKIATYCGDRTGRLFGDAFL